MRRVLRRAIGGAAVVSAAAGAVAVFTHGLRALVLDAWLLAIGGVVLLALFRVARLLAPKTASPFDGAVERMRPQEAPLPDLALERDVALSRANDLHFHVRLRPVLREIAAHRLRSRYGVELEREPGRARELVPARAWEVVDPDRPPPEDRLRAGPRVESLSAVVDELERL